MDVLERNKIDTDSVVINEEVGIKEKSIKIQTENLTWNELLKNNTFSQFTKIITLDITPPVDDEIVIISHNDGPDSKNIPTPTQIYLSYSDHKFIYDPSIKNIELNKYSNLGKPYPGFVLLQTSIDRVVYSITTFEQSKKIIAVFRKEEKCMYPTKVILLEPKDIITEIEENIDSRNVNEELTTYDEIICMNTSKKFGKIAKESKTLMDLYLKFEDILFKTTDPSYIYKLILLQNTIAYYKR